MRAGYACPPFIGRWSTGSSELLCVKQISENKSISAYRCYFDKAVLTISRIDGCADIARSVRAPPLPPLSWPCFLLVTERHCFGCRTGGDFRKDHALLCANPCVMPNLRSTDTAGAEVPTRRFALAKGASCMGPAAELPTGFGPANRRALFCERSNGFVRLYPRCSQSI